MADEGSWIPPGVDTGRANVARIYDYLVGGSHNFLADQDVARAMIAVDPNIRAMMRANRAFLGRAVRYLVAEAGVDLHHLPAHGGFVDGSGEVGAVTGVEPVGGGAGDEALVDRPDHKAVAGISAPEGAVAIEDGDAGSGCGDELLELLRGPARGFNLLR